MKEHKVRTVKRSDGIYVNANDLATAIETVNGQMETIFKNVKDQNFASEAYGSIVDFLRELT